MSLEEFDNFLCPYCGQPNTLPVDVSGGSSQHFVTDCEICCAPIAVSVRMRGGHVTSIDVRREND